jgi:hypothetical protein
MQPQELATACLKFLKNVDGTAPNEHRYTLTDDAPEWFGDLVRECHFGLLPNDWSFRFVRDSLMLCENCDSDGPQVDIDSEYPYTADRLNWFASSLDRPAYCDEFAEEFGSPAATVLDRVGQGMWYELDSVAQRVWSALAQQCEAAEEAAEVE